MKRLFLPEKDIGNLYQGKIIYRLFLNKMIKKIAILLLVIAFSQYTFAQINFAMFEFNSDADYIDIELQSGNNIQLHNKGKFSVILPYYADNDRLIKITCHNHLLVNQQQITLEVWPAFIQKDPTIYSWNDGVSITYATLKVSIFDAHGGSNQLEYNASKKYFCYGETLNLNFSNVASLSSPYIPALLQIRLSAPYKSEWKDLQQFGYSPQPISFDNINSFVINHFGVKSIVDDNNHKFELRVNIAGICTIEKNLYPYYPPLDFSKDNITLTSSYTENILKISNNNGLKVSVIDDFYNNPYNENNEQAQYQEFPVNDGRCTIRIEHPDKTSCSIEYYANVMRLKNNQISTCDDNKADFWHSAQESRGDEPSVVLHYFMSGICPKPLFPIEKHDTRKEIEIVRTEYFTNDNIRKFEQRDDGVQGQEGKPVSSTLYYLKGCTKGEHEFVVTYDNPLFIPQKLTYNLSSSFEGINIKKEDIEIDDPVCQDNEGMIHFKNISGGLGCGYYYKRVSKDGEVVEDNKSISDKMVDIPIKEGDIITIYDKKIREDEQYPYTEQRKFTYTVDQLASATPPTIETSVINPLCNGETGSLNVEVNIDKVNWNYSWVIQNSDTKLTYRGSEPKEPDVTKATKVMTINGLAPLEEGDIYTSVFTLKKDNKVCWEIKNLPAFTLIEPKKIEFTPKPVSLTCMGSNDGEINISDSDVKNIRGTYTAFYYPVVENKEQNITRFPVLDTKGNPTQLTEGHYKVLIVDSENDCESESIDVEISIQTPEMSLETTAASCELAENGQALFKRSNRFNPNQICWYKSNEKQDVLSPSMVNAEDGLLEHKALFPGWYKVTFKDTKKQMCSCESTFEIVFNTYSFSSSTGNASCATAPNGSAEISATISTTEGNKQGEFNPTCYSWTLQKNQSNKNITEHTSTTNTISGLLPGIYKVEINHDENCTSSTEVVIGTNTYNFQGTQYHDLSCVDASNGYITAQINKSGNGDFNIKGYEWHVKPHGSFNNSSQDKNIFYLSGINEGEYTLEINHDNYCTESTTVNISVNDYEWSTNHLYLSCEEVKNGYISATINRKDDFNGVFKINKYSWTVNDKPYKSGENPANEKDGTYSFELTDLAPGLYKLSLTHDDKCTESTTVKIDVNQYSHFVNTTNAPCAEIPSATATAVTEILSGTEGSFKPIYTWTVKNSKPEPTGSVNTISNRFFGDYNVKIEWANGCSESIDFTIQHDTLKPSLLTTNAECSDKESVGGKAVLNISTPDKRTYSYSWDTQEDNNNIKENLPAGSHNVTVIDNHGCHLDVPFTILNANFSADVKTENALCRQDATGKVTFDIKGGRGMYTINWNGNSNLSQKNISTGIFTQENIPVGIYHVDIKDETNCVVSHKVTISSGNLKVSHKESDASCASIGNAQAEITVSGAKLPVTYKWSDNVETSEPLRSNLSKGNYVVTVVDQNDCSMPVDINIYSKKLSAETAIDSATCGIDTDGAADIRLYSATAPFSFKWSDGKTTTTGRRDGMAKGEYTVHITDANGCEMSTDVFVPHKGYLQNDVPGSITLCTNGEITVDANEFIGYQWIYNGRYIDDNRFLTIKSPGTYLIKANGYDDCYAVDTIAVSMSSKSFSPYFRMSSVSYINDTLVVMEMSQTNPDKYSWKYDTLAFDLDNTKGSDRELRLIPKISGIYSITLSAENEDCVSDISKPVEIFATTRPDDDLSPLYVDNSIVKEFTISPNPTKGPITVEVNLSQIADVRLTIYDLNFGKIRKQVTLHNSDNYKLDINDVLYTGAYVVILQAGNETKQIKYIVGR